MLEDLTPILLITILAVLFLKFIFWLLITDVRNRVKFVPSFVRLYSMYQMHDAPSKKTAFFWKLSNILNFVFWIAVVCIGFHFLNQVFKESV